MCWACLKPPRGAQWKPDQPYCWSGLISDDYMSWNWWKLHYQGYGAGGEDYIYQGYGGDGDICKYKCSCSMK